MNNRQLRPELHRRDFLKLTAAGAALLGTGGFSWPRDSLAMAEAAGAWIRHSGREVSSGLTWPVAPGVDETDVLHLYSGTPGIILFLLELHHATGKEEYLRDAEAGARYLLAASASGPGNPKLPDWGLYTGLAGVVYTLFEVYRAGGDSVIGQGARARARKLIAAAKPVDGGVAWFGDDPNQASYDIVGGIAGIGLTLLYLHELGDGMPGDARAGGDPAEVELAASALDVAIQAGHFLREQGRPEHNGLKWPMSEAYPRLMPNFSHGTAGVAYFLARLYEVTGDIAFLAPAIYGSVYLVNVSICDAEGGCRIFHHEPDGEDLYYLGWCHGPTGTARPFVQLARVTGEEDEYLKRVEQGRRGILHQGIPEARPEGYWNNVSQCCGDAGVGDYFLSLSALTGSAEDLQFARRLGDYLGGQATEAGDQARWIQAENRTQPENVVAQTGWMQGAAGIGAFFLHLDGMEKGRRARVVFPDSPWRGLI